MSEDSRKPSIGFDDFDLSPSLRRGIIDAGFEEPRPVQAATVPAALEGRDVMGLAQTGTGKTAAFGWALLHRLEGKRPEDGPRALVVAPTRELASQIAEEITTLGRHTKLTVGVVFGGVSQHSQVKMLRRKPDILVACPGRLLDLFRQGEVRLDRVEALVLDEADHMFDMGFLPDVRRILVALPDRRQNLLFSATMPREIRRLANQVLDDPYVVDLTRSRPAPTIDHAIYPVPEGSKRELLSRVLDEDGFVSAIVFTRTKHRAKKLAKQLDAEGHRAIALQGNMSQNARQRAMDGFRNKTYDVLVATDIAARGIDVEQVSHVVNFDMPTTADAYTHRIGRTGRSERTGRAYTFVTTEDIAMVREVEQRIGAPLDRRSVKGVESAPFPAAGDNSRPPRPTGRRPASSRGRDRARPASGGGSSTSRPAAGSGGAGAGRRRRRRRSKASAERAS